MCYFVKDLVTFCQEISVKWFLWKKYFVIESLKLLNFYWTKYQIGVNNNHFMFSEILRLNIYNIYSIFLLVSIKSISLCYFESKYKYLLILQPFSAGISYTFWWSNWFYWFYSIKTISDKEQMFLFAVYQTWSSLSNLCLWSCARQQEGAEKFSTQPTFQNMIKHQNLFSFLSLSWSGWELLSIPHQPTQYRYLVGIVQLLAN